jgi:hypothetical protein
LPSGILSVEPTISSIPSAEPTPEGCPVANEVGHEGAWGNLTDVPIEITAIDPDKYVAFRLKQTIVQGSAYYLSIMYECVCVRFYNASADEIYPELIGECHDGEATVSIYVQDPTLSDNGEVDIPEQCAPMNSYPPSVSRVAYHFALPCGKPCPDDDISNGGDQTISPTSSPSAVCEQDTVVAFEDFEGGNAESWEKGTISNTPVFSNFLGRLGLENDYVRKTFVVPTNAQSVTVEFLLYEIDNWLHCDKLTILIGNKRLDLKQFYSEDIYDNPNNIEEGRKGGIMWSRHSVVPARNVAFNSRFKDQIHKVDMTIPANYFSEGELEFAVRVTMNNGVDDASAGIDNLKVTAHGVCVEGSDRLLGQDEDERDSIINYPSSHVASEPQWDGDDEGPYCSSKDFPCNGENNVYICHYNPHLGYQTFCVPEEESDIVKFYANSYCGPCVGGFGGKWH